MKAKSGNKPFNGHKNWNHWNVALWITNDEGLYRRAVELIREQGEDAAARTLLEELPRHTPDGAPYSITTVRAALRGLT